MKLLKKKLPNDHPAPNNPMIAPEKKAGAANPPAISGSQKVSGSNIFGGSTPIQANPKLTPSEVAGPDQDQRAKNMAEKRWGKSGREIFGGR